MYYKQNDYNVKYPDVKVDNFRDLGGIKLTNGRTVKDNLIFRSGALYDLPDEVKTALDKLNIGYIFDLRGYDEVEYKPDYVPQGTEYRNIPAVKTHGSLVVKPDSVVKMIPVWLPASFSGRLFMLRFKHLYRKFPFRNKAYAEMFEVMDKGESFLFHCSAGKDRTGVASMLILLALGADLETVKNDYMLSNFYRIESNVLFNKQFEKEKHYDKYVKIFEVSCNVHMELFDAAYNKIIRKYKTVENFLYSEYAIDGKRVAKWLELYTE